jgi:mono/diheme cytochrome c family protein
MMSHFSRPPLLVIALLGLTGCLPQTKPAEQATGPADFAAYCSACHGAAGKGDGELAAELAKKPADLTMLAAKNGGTFPTTRVMAQIWGYAGKKGQGVMPDFGPLLDGELVLYDGGDGIETPTPIRLVQIAEYVKTLQK